MRVCSVHGCPEIYPAGEGSRCSKHRRHADRQRGTAADRGYNDAAHQVFRNAVLEANPICVMCELAEATEADHYPRSRRELIALHLDPNDPRFGRGLCARCHSISTAQLQPGGWNAAR